MRIRAAEDGDLPAIAAIAAANDDEGVGSAADPSYVAHLRSAGRFLVAEEDGMLAGYCGTRPIGPATMLCDLFIHPDRQGRGIGGQLLGAVFTGAGERFTYASKDPRALPLYVRHGMIPHWPLLYLRGDAGTPAADGAGGAASRRVPAAERVPAAQRAPVAERVPMALAASAEREITGRDRSADYAYWGTVPGSTGLIVRAAGQPAAAAAAAPGRLLHLVCGRGADADAVLAAAAAEAGPGEVRLCLPGPHPAVPRLLDAGWRIYDYDHYMASRPELVSTGDAPSSALG